MTMECRKPLLVVVIVLGSLAGCVTVPTTQPSGAPAGSSPTAEKDEPKKIPKPGTFVALGNFKDGEAAQKQKEPLLQEQLRDEARRAYQEALRIDPAYMPAYLALGQLYITLEEYPRALATFKQGLEKHPKEGSLWFALGMCQARQKEWAGAVEALRHAIGCDPENRQYINLLGYCLARAGRYEESLACFRQTGSEARAHYNLARMLHHLQQDVQAREHLQRALQADPRLEPAQQLLASLNQGTAPEASAVVPARFDQKSSEASPQKQGP